jgi:hypothetical protein
VSYLENPIGPRRRHRVIVTSYMVTGKFGPCLRRGGLLLCIALFQATSVRFLMSPFILGLLLSISQLTFCTTLAFCHRTSPHLFHPRRPGARRRALGYPKCRFLFGHRCPLSSSPRDRLCFPSIYPLPPLLNSRRKHVFVYNSPG